MAASDHKDEETKGRGNNKEDYHLDDKENLENHEQSDLTRSKSNQSNCDATNRIETDDNCNNICGSNGNESSPIIRKLIVVILQRWKHFLSYCSLPFQRQIQPQSENEIYQQQPNSFLLWKFFQKRLRQVAPQTRHQFMIGGVVLAITSMLVGYRNRQRVMNTIRYVVRQKLNLSALKQGHKGQLPPQNLRNVSNQSSTATKSMDKDQQYRQLAVEAPLSTLLRAISDGSVQRALVGSQVVYYFLANKSRNIDTGSSGVARANGSGWKQSTLPANNSQLHNHILDKLTASSQMIDVSLLKEVPSIFSRLSTPLLASLPFIYLALLYRMLQKNFPHLNQDSSSGHDILDQDPIERHRNQTTTKFADVGGLDSILEELKQIVDYCQYPQKYQSLGAHPPRGILLYGPSGTGKTLLAKALAGEAFTFHDKFNKNKNTTHVVSSAIDSFTVCSASEFVEVYVGQGAARVRSLFASARKRALQKYLYKFTLERKKQTQAGVRWNKWFGGDENIRRNAQTNGVLTHSSSVAMRQPTALIFIDELDAVAKARSGSSQGSFLQSGLSNNSNDEREQTLNQLLTEMDGFLTSTGTTRTSPPNGNNYKHYNLNDVLVIVVAATNRVQVLDPAILRRLERQIEVGYPTVEGRCEILQIHARHLWQSNHNNGDHIETDAAPTNQQPKTTQELDWKQLAEASHGMTGADLRTIVNDATLLALRETTMMGGESIDQSNQRHKVEKTSMIPTEEKSRISHMKTTMEQFSRPIVTMEHFEKAIQRLQQSKKQSQQHHPGGLRWA